jgi:NADH dehydrogenase FAD-containing subunit
VGDDFSIGKELGIYCIGDMVANKGPPSAQNARIQGEYLARYFNSGFDKNFLETNKFEVKSAGKLVHLLKDTYLESEYYSGFIPWIVNGIIEWVNK